MQASCVFCGRPLADDDQVAGRPPHAAHVACADAALADDAHWEEIAAAGPPEEAQSTGRRAGCLPATLLMPALGLARYRVGRRHGPGRRDDRARR